MKIDFNLSHSLINTYKECERNFFYGKIMKAKKEQTLNCYGIAGNIVHSVLENYYDKPIADIKEVFSEIWDNSGLETEHLDMLGRPLSKVTYWNCILNGVKRNLDIKENEMKFEFNYNKHILKGFVDLVLNAREGDITDADNKIIDEQIKKHSIKYEDIILGDWKTNSQPIESVEQLKLYSYFWFKKFNSLPKKCIYYMLKLDMEISYIPTIEDMIYVDKNLITMLKSVYSKKSFDDFKILDKYQDEFFCKYFCGYKDRCKKDMIKKNIHSFTINISNKARVSIDYKTSNPEHRNIFYSKLKQYFTFKSIDDKGLMAMKRNRILIARKPFILNWDGKECLEKKGTYPIGVLGFLPKLINAFIGNDLADIRYNDERKETELVEDLPKNPKGLTLRHYQNLAVDTMLRAKTGMVSIEVGGGKTLMSAELYRRNPIKTLFVIDTKALLTQSVKEYAEQLGLSIDSIGTITQGEYKVVGNLTFATIQTIAIKIKNKDKELINYLNNVEQLILDEMQITKAKSFELMFKEIHKAKYMFGMSGTIPKNDIKFYKIQSYLGFDKPIVEVKQEELTKSGVLIKPTINFIDYDLGYMMKGSFIDIKEQVVNNKNRIDIVAKIIEKHKGVLQMILVDRISQANLIEDKLKSIGIKPYIIIGVVSNKVREEILDKAKADKNLVIIATQSIASKGLNLKPLRVMINTSVNGSEIQATQSLGRVIRSDEGKTDAFYYDFFDNINYLEDSSNNRIKAFQDNGYEVNRISK